MSARILLDTSIWIDHLAGDDPHVAQLLRSDSVLMHPFVIGEIVCGNLRNRRVLFKLLNDLPQVKAAQHDEVILFLERHSLFGKGIGWIDAHLLAAVVLTSGARFWTRDKRLDAAADALGIKFSEAGAHALIPRPIVWQ